MSGNNVQDHYAGDDTGSGMVSRILAAVRAVYGQDAAITPKRWPHSIISTRVGWRRRRNQWRSWNRMRASPC